MFNFVPTFRALTFGSPITTALRQAHQMARRHLDKGGAATIARGPQAPEGFVVPSGIDAAALAAAIEGRLRAGGNARSGRSGGLSNLLERRRDKRIVVPPAVLERLGDGKGDRGKRVLERLISEMRRRRGVSSFA
jgi:hypothetical protein